MKQWCSIFLFLGLLFSVFHRSLSQQLVQVTGGTFAAGSTPVTISSFKMDKYEVTYEFWTEVRNWALTHGYTDLEEGQSGSNPSGTNNPATNVSWYDIVKWCNARSEREGLTPVFYTRSLQDTVYRTGRTNINVDAVKWSANGYRLPTEAEWEFAARGGNSTHAYTYSGSNTVGDVAWYSGNSGITTHTVGQKAANKLGIYDMSGNVWEWCWDWYGSAYPSGGTIDPKGPSATQTYRLLRGGSFVILEDLCRVVFRNGAAPSTLGSGDLGFRCVQEIGTNGIGNIRPETPSSFSLNQNYPNPFNPSTTIRYALPNRSSVKIVVTNTLGQQVAVLENGDREAGYNEVQWNAKVASGIYFYRIDAVSISDPNNRFVQVKKMLLLK